MAQIARCPACKTRFKIVPDQLRIADGWVRCGRCAQLFNAREQREPTADTAPPIPRATVPEGSAADLVAATRTVDPVRPSPADDGPRDASGNDAHGGLPTIDPHFDTPAPAADLHAGIRALAGAQDEDARAAPDWGVPPPAFSATDDDGIEPAWTPPAAEVPAASATGTGATPRDPAFAPAATAPRENGPELAAAPGMRNAAITPRADDAPYFARATPRRAGFWNSRAVRTASWPLAIVLALLLFGQWLHAEADWLAARWTPLEPVVKTLCVPFLCRVEPYRQLDAIRIEDSSLKALDSDSFRLDIAVRNSATVAVATPAFELTLSDLGRQVLVRRVISATELGAPPMLAARGTFKATRALRIGDGVQPGAIANYQVVAFYP